MKSSKGAKIPGTAAAARISFTTRSNICIHFRHERGDVDAGLRDADAVFEDTFYFPSAQHYPMEPHVCVAHFEGETLTVWSATQSPFPVRQELARMFGCRLAVCASSCPPSAAATAPRAASRPKASPLVCRA